MKHMTNYALANDGGIGKVTGISGDTDSKYIHIKDAKGNDYTYNSRDLIANGPVSYMFGAIAMLLDHGEIILAAATAVAMKQLLMQEEGLV